MCTDIHRKIFRESASRTRKIFKKMFNLSRNPENVGDFMVQSKLVLELIYPKSNKEILSLHEIPHLYRPKAVLQIAAEDARTTIQW